MRSSFFLSGLACFALLVSISLAQPPQWGDMTGRIVADQSKPGPVPKPINVAIHWGGMVPRGTGPIPDETWVVHPKNDGLRDAFVWIESIEKGKKLPIHPDLQAIPKKIVEVDQPNFYYVPHALAMRQGQIFVVKNSASMNTCFNYQGNPAIQQPYGNFVLTPRKSFEIHDFLADRIPVTMSSICQPWMKGLLRIYDHPYFAVTDSEGKFTIPKAPVGEVRLKIWHGSAGWLGGPQGKNGEPLAIKAGDNQLADRPFPFPPGQTD